MEEVQDGAINICSVSNTCSPHCIWFNIQRKHTKPFYKCLFPLQQT